MKLPLAATLLATSLSANAATYGPVANFDVINDTGKIAHGFEIELDGIAPSDITSLFGQPNRWPGMERYGVPVVTTTATGVRVTYRDDTKSTPSGTLTVSPHDSCWPLGAPGQYGPLYPCDHFGVSTSKPTPVVRYNWLTESTPWPAGATTGPISKTDAFVPNVQVVINPAPPAVVIQPPAPAPGLPLPPPINQPPAAAIHAVMAAPVPNLWEFGEPRWVKVTATGSLNNIAVEDLMGNNALMQKAQKQIEWQRLQYDANATGGGANGTIDLTGVKLDPGAVAIAYRFEYYAYKGDFDTATHEAIGILGPDGVTVIPGSNVDTSGSTTPPVTVGRYLGAQMAGANFDGGIPPAPPLPIAPTINAKIAGGVVGQPYGSTFDVTPIVAADLLQVTITGLPADLTYSTVGSKVTISGTPSVVGSFPIIIKADDITNNTSISASTAIDIADAPMIFNVAFDPATVGTPYVYSFSVLGGYGNKTYSTVSPVPAGLSIVNDTLAGTPTIDGTFPIIMSVKDSLGFSQNAASSSLVVSKAPAVVVPPIPAPVACLGNNKVMTSASATVAEIAGGIANSGQTVDLPVSVSFTAPLTVADAFAANNLLTYSGTVDNATKHCVADVAAIAQGLNVFIPVPYHGQVGVEFSPTPADIAAGGVPIQISIAGGIGPYTVIANGLPLGMSLDANYTLVGIPTVAGTYNVSISVNDNNGQISNGSMALVIDPAPVAIPCAGVDEAIVSNTWRLTKMATWDGTIISSAYVTTANNNVAIPAAGVAYSFLQGLANGSFPTGGLISYSGTYGAANGPNGTPMWCIPTSVMVKPKPAVCAAPQVLDIPTNTCVTPLSIAVPTLPSGTVGVFYSTTFTGPTGGLAPYTVMVAAPAGLSGALSGTTVTLAGKPTANGTFPIGISVVDANNKTFATTASLTIAPAPLTCTAPTGSKTYNGIQGNAKAFNGTSVTIGFSVVNVPACAAIVWEGNWTGLTKAIRVGYNVQVQKGYVLNGVITATSLTVDNGL